MLRGYLTRLYTLPGWMLVLAAVIYSILIYGFFMGFPVFNAVIGAAGGYVAAKRSCLDGGASGSRRRNTCLAAGVSTLLLLMLCVTSAILALREPSICAQLRSMLGLPFPVTMPMVWMLILGGGTLLLAGQYGLLRLLEAVTYRRCRPPLTFCAM